MNTSNLADSTVRNIINEIKAFNSKSKINFFTYIPLVGISSETDSKDYTTFYNYNTSNRLSSIQDNDKNIIKSFSYWYIPNVYYNVAQERQFTKNDCANNTGTKHYYYVSAGIYSSSLSQEDADQKALNDINTNGQAYVNTIGTCGIVKPYIENVIRPYVEIILSETSDKKITIIRGNVGFSIYNDANATIPYSHFTEDHWYVTVNYKITTNPGLEINNQPLTTYRTVKGEEWENIFWDEVPLSKRIYVKRNNQWLLESQVDNIFEILVDDSYNIIQ